MNMVIRWLNQKLNIKTYMKKYDSNEYDIEKDKERFH